MHLTRLDYAFGGALIRSAVPLPSLVTALDSNPPGPVITVVPSHTRLEGQLLFQWPDPGGLRLEQAQDGWIYRLPLQGLAAAIDQSGNTVHLEYSGHADLAEDFLVRRVLPRLMEIHGRVLLHGATLAIAGPDGGAIVLIGRSQAGKSTLAAALSRSGPFQSMGDDTAILEADDSGWHVYASTRDECLWPDSAAAINTGGEAHRQTNTLTKVRRPAAGEPVHGMRHLRAIYVIDTAPTPRIDPLSQYRAIQHLVRNAIRFNPGDRGAEASRLARLCTLVRQVPVARFCYPRDYERLDDVCNTLTREHAPHANAHV